MPEPAPQPNAPVNQPQGTEAPQVNQPLDNDPYKGVHNTPKEDLSFADPNAQPNPSDPKPESQPEGEPQAQPQPVDPNRVQTLEQQVKDLAVINQQMEYYIRQQLAKEQQLQTQNTTQTPPQPNAGQPNIDEQTGEEYFLTDKNSPDLIKENVRAVLQEQEQKNQQQQWWSNLFQRKETELSDKYEFNGEKDKIMQRIHWMASTLINNGYNPDLAYEEARLGLTKPKGLSPQNTNTEQQSVLNQGQDGQPNVVPQDGISNQGSQGMPETNSTLNDSQQQLSKGPNTALDAQKEIVEKLEQLAPTSNEAWRKLVDARATLRSMKKQMQQ